MSRKNVEDIYPLSPVQHGMLFHALDTSQPGVYMGQLGWTLQGTLDLPAFQKAWQEVVDRHPILRTAFVWERLEDPMQLVKKGVVLPIEEHDLRSLSESEQRAWIERFLREDSRRGFDLTRAPLMRLSLIRLRSDTYRFIWSRHHLLLDGWSTPILLKEVFSLYEGHAEGREVKLDRPRPYGEYIAWLQKQDLKRAEVFWKKELEGFHAPTPLTVDRPPAPGAIDRVFDERTLDLPEATANALQAFAWSTVLMVS